MPSEPDGEFALLAENAVELGLPFTPPVIRRIAVPVSADHSVSCLQWGRPPASLVLLHGGGQNAHTWDSVLLALGHPALAIDLPGHGHSDWRADHDYSGQTNAPAVATVLRSPGVDLVTPVMLVGMSLGGLTALSLASRFPELVQALLLVDVLPQSLTRYGELSQRQRGSVALTTGPPSYDSFDAMLQATVAASPTRSRSSLRRGALHNAKEMPDGRWQWRYDMARMTRPESADPGVGWGELSGITVPVTLIRGADSGFVHDDDVAELSRRQPRARIHVVAGSGHSVQSDQPLALTALLQEFLKAQKALQ